MKLILLINKQAHKEEMDQSSRAGRN